MSLWEKRLHELNLLLQSGKTLAEIGTYYGVSKQRIEQVIRKYLPTLTRHDYGASKRRYIKTKNRLDEIKIRFNRESFQDLTDLEEAQSRFFTRKRQNAKSSKWNWSLVMSDLDWPSHCPILGIELDWFAEKTQENSPSIDRLDSNKGYMKDNVAIMSWRANRIKNNGTGEEHQKIADYLLQKGL